MRWILAGVVLMILLLLLAGLAGAAVWMLWPMGSGEAPTEPIAVIAGQATDPPDLSAVRAEQLAAAQLAYSGGDTARAIALLDMLLDQSPDDADALLLRGRAWAKQQENLRAIDDFSRVLELRPADIEARDYRALMRMQRRQYEEALVDVGVLIGADAKNGRFWKLQADCQYPMGRTKEALESARIACDLGDADGCELLKKIRAVTGQ